MREGRRRARVALLLGAAGLIACAGTASATSTPWARWTVPDGGFSITIPKSWFLVPNTVPRVEADIKRLAEENQAAVAQIYASMIATRQEREALARYRFEAFAFSTLPVTPTVMVAIDHTTKALTHDLGAIARSEARSGTANAQWHVADARVVSLPAGPAAYIDGTRPTPRGTVEFADYFVEHGSALYLLSLSADAKAPDIGSLSTTFAAIARHFAFG